VTGQEEGKPYQKLAQRFTVGRLTTNSGCRRFISCHQKTSDYITWDKPVL